MQRWGAAKLIPDIEDDAVETWESSLLATLALLDPGVKAILETEGSSYYASSPLPLVGGGKTEPQFWVYTKPIIGVLLDGVDGPAVRHGPDPTMLQDDELLQMHLFARNNKAVNNLATLYTLSLNIANKEQDEALTSAFVWDADGSPYLVQALTQGVDWVSDYLAKELLSDDMFDSEQGVILRMAAKELEDTVWRGWQRSYETDFSEEIDRLRVTIDRLIVHDVSGSQRERRLIPHPEKISTSDLLVLVHEMRTHPERFQHAWVEERRFIFGEDGPTKYFDTNLDVYVDLAISRGLFPEGTSYAHTDVSPPISVSTSLGFGKLLGGLVPLGQVNTEEEIAPPEASCDSIDATVEDIFVASVGLVRGSIQNTVNLGELDYDATPSGFHIYLRFPESLYRICMPEEPDEFEELPDPGALEPEQLLAMDEDIRKRPERYAFVWRGAHPDLPARTAFINGDTEVRCSPEDNPYRQELALRHADSDQNE